MGEGPQLELRTRGRPRGWAGGEAGWGGGGPRPENRHREDCHQATGTLTRCPACPQECHLPSNGPCRPKIQSSGTTRQRARDREGPGSGRAVGGAPRRSTRFPSAAQEGEDAPAAAVAARGPQGPEADPQGGEGREGVPEEVQGVACSRAGAHRRRRAIAAAEAGGRPQRRAKPSSLPSPQFEGDIVTLTRMMIDPNAKTRRGGGKHLGIRRGEILEVIEFTNKEEMLCRDAKGKCEWARTRPGGRAPAGRNSRGPLSPQTATCPEPLSCPCEWRADGRGARGRVRGARGARPSPSQTCRRKRALRPPGKRRCMTTWTSGVRSPSGQAGRAHGAPGGSKRPPHSLGLLLTGTGVTGSHPSLADPLENQPFPRGQ